THLGHRRSATPSPLSKSTLVDKIVRLWSEVDMRRREFLGLVGSAAAALPLTVWGQQTNRTYRIGILGPSRDAPVISTQYKAFVAELDGLGFREGRNLVIDYQRVDSTQGPFVAAGELMSKQPDLLWANGPEVALKAVVGASGSTPVIFLAVNFD